MNAYIKIPLLGTLIWGVPFIVSFFFWDIITNTAKINEQWFYALMALSWTIGFSFAAYFYFKNIKKTKIIKHSIIVGIIWYIECILLDVIFLVTLLNMELKEYAPLFLVYLNTFILTIAIGNIKTEKKKKKKN